MSCVNDVIRCRRKMLGMSRKQLYENIWKTLGRLERCETSTQKEITAMLLERLDLPREFTRTELVTDSPEARQLMEMLKYQVSLWLRRMSQLGFSLYDRWWNDAERKRKGISAKHDFEDMEEITRCMIIARLSKQYNREHFFRKKLKALGQTN